MILVALGILALGSADAGPAVTDEDRHCDHYISALDFVRRKQAAAVEAAKGEGDTERADKLTSEMKEQLAALEKKVDECRQSYRKKKEQDRQNPAGKESAERARNEAARSAIESQQMNEAAAAALRERAKNAAVDRFQKPEGRAFAFSAILCASKAKREHALAKIREVENAPKKLGGKNVKSLNEARSDADAAQLLIKKHEDALRTSKLKAVKCADPVIQQVVECRKKNYTNDDASCLDPKVQEGLALMELAIGE